MSTFLLLTLAFFYANYTALLDALVNSQASSLNLDSLQTLRSNLEAILLQDGLRKYTLLPIQHVRIHMVCLDSYNSGPSASSKARDLHCVLTFHRTFQDAIRIRQISDSKMRDPTQPAIVKGYLLLFSNSSKSPSICL